MVELVTASFHYSPGAIGFPSFKKWLLIINYYTVDFSVAIPKETPRLRRYFITINAYFLMVLEERPSISQALLYFKNAR